VSFFFELRSGKKKVSDTGPGPGEKKWQSRKKGQARARPGKKSPSSREKGEVDGE